MDTVTHIRNTQPMTLTVGSLFSGIGGIDLGLERAGMTVKWQSEIDPYACQVLKKHWPDIPNLGDIKTVDWSTVKPVDLIAGGYPCQPFSTAGKRQGENDPRHLWPYFRNAISAIRPRFALLENVRGHLTMGGTTVIGDLAEIGYNCEWQLISAASIGAPHRRERIIIVAYPEGQFGNDLKNNARNGMESKKVSEFGNSSRPKNLADTDSLKLDSNYLYGTNKTTFSEAQTIFTASRRSSVSATGSNWLSEPDVGRVANGIPARVDRLRGLGNAVVPQVAEYVGRLILQSLA
jgi:DNA (cytosine-5)-methyltransferase 1